MGRGKSEPYPGKRGSCVISGWRTGVDCDGLSYDRSALLRLAVFYFFTFFLPPPAHHASPFSKKRTEVVASHPPSYPRPAAVVVEADLMLLLLLLQQMFLLLFLLFLFLLVLLLQLLPLSPQFRLVLVLLWDILLRRKSCQFSSSPQVFLPSLGVLGLFFFHYFSHCCCWSRLRGRVLLAAHIRHMSRGSTKLAVEWTTLHNNEDLPAPTRQNVGYLQKLVTGHCHLQDAMPVLLLTAVHSSIYIL